MALDFNLACTHRLLQFDNEREFARLKMFKVTVKSAIAELVSGTAPTEDLEDADATEPNENDIL